MIVFNAEEEVKTRKTVRTTYEMFKLRNIICLMLCNVTQNMYLTPGVIFKK